MPGVEWQQPLCNHIPERRSRGSPWRIGNDREGRAAQGAPSVGLEQAATSGWVTAAGSAAGEGRDLEASGGRPGDCPATLSDGWTASRDPRPGKMRQPPERSGGCLPTSGCGGPPSPKSSCLPGSTPTPMLSRSLAVCRQLMAAWTFARS